MSEQVEAETVETEESEAIEVEAGEETQEVVEVDPFKAKWEGQRKVNRDLERKLNEANAKLADIDKSPDEKAIDEARREAVAEATAKANQRVIASEFRAAAAKRGLDAKTVLKLADLSSVEMGDDGEIDPADLAAVLDAVVEEHPSVVPSRFTGTADQGTRGKEAKPSQLSRDDLKNMTPDQILTAEKEGRLDKIKGLTK